MMKNHTIGYKRFLLFCAILFWSSLLLLRFSEPNAEANSSIYDTEDIRTPSNKLNLSQIETFNRSLVYFNMTPELHEKLEYAAPGKMLEHCENRINIWLPSSKDYQRFAYLKDIVSYRDPSVEGGVGTCLVARRRDVDSSTRQNVMKQLYIPRVHGTRACEKLHNFQKVNPTYQLSIECSETEDIIEPEVKIEVYNPFLITVNDAIINQVGTVIKGMSVIGLISPCAAAYNDKFDPPVKLGPLKFRNVSMLTEHDKVFVVSQIWGDNHYHALVEDLPRIAFHIDELLSMSDVKIHVTQGTQAMLNYLNLLGFPKERIIQGPVNASTVFLPETSLRCGRAGAEQLSELRRRLRLGYAERFGQTTDNAKNKLQGVIVKRKSARSIKNFEGFQKLVERYFPEVEFHLYDDKNLPTWNETFRMWYNADIVIAPHGAGLSNSVLCKEGTVIIEFITQDTNLCFMQMSLDLNFKYHTMLPEVSSHGGPMIVELDELEFLLMEIRNDMFQA
ncbi:hypothetical protein MP638_001029 [Amoeboaphelidium occidentale]|nr:hypothetical protein MP638_001029 [Amoeboaphelidium occidentale]